MLALSISYILHIRTVASVINNIGTPETTLLMSLLYTLLLCYHVAFGS